MAMSRMLTVRIPLSSIFQYLNVRGHLLSSTNFRGFAENKIRDELISTYKKN